MTTKLAARKAAQTDLDFTVFSRAVAEQFKQMSAHTLYRVRLTSSTPFEAGELEQDQTKNILWDAYQAAWPDGTNEIFRERREHDCQTCKGFIRTVGVVVCIVDGQLQSIWDCPSLPEPYATVALKMAELVKGGTIDNLFLHTERQAGVVKNFQQVVKDAEGDVSTLTWNHFAVTLPNAVVVAKKDIGPKLADARATHDVLLRGLEELTLDSVDTVLELVAQNSLYRGEEYRASLLAFRKLKVEYGVENAARPSGHDVGASVLKMADKMYGRLGSRDAELEHARDIFAWNASRSTHPAAARIRNTAIGTLLIDLSAGVELEDAVKKFETSIMAPSNYKRPTALVSKAMIEKARKTIDELGLASALERRYAVLEDITVNNILFADRSSAKLLGGSRGGGKTAAAAGVFDSLAESVAENPKNYDKVEEIGIDKFLADVLPKAKSLEVLFENRHAGNLVSLVAPVDPTAPNLFKWPNGFSWSYAGDVADSIKERVKRAGGSVVGDLCCRLAWDYTDDLDFHMQEPGTPSNLIGYGDGGNHIYYGNVRRLSANGGMLDLDANGCDGMKAEPAENIFYADKAKMREGVYTLTVNNYSRRSTGVGFEAQVEVDGVTHHFVYEKALRSMETVLVAAITYSKGAFTVESDLKSSQSSKQVWGLQTQKFQKANVVMLSPNFWNLAEDDLEVGYRGFSGVGNKHWFFVLEGCANEGTARPFYNEFLRADLDPHRKTLEMVGAKLRTDESARQLSGLGFSSTKRDHLTVRVTGSLVRVLKVVF